MPEEEKEHVQDYIAALRTQYSRELSDSQSAVETLRQENGELRQALMEARRDVILIQSELDRLRKVSENRTPPTWNHAFSTDALYRRMLGAVSGCVSSWSVALWSDRRPPERLGDTTGRCHRVQRRVLRYRSGQSESVLDLISSDHVVDGGDVGGQEDISEFRGGGSGGSGRRNTLNLRRRLFAFPSQSEDALLGGGQLCEPILRLVLVGDVGSGKSSFLLQLRHHRFTGDVQPTVGVDCYVKQMFVDGQMTTLQIWDTAGLERFSSVSRSYFRRADGILLLYDITSEKSFRSLPNWIAQIQECADAAVPLCLIGNKVDLRSELPESECVSSACGERLAMACGALFCETSAKDGTNVVEAVLHLARKVKLSSGMCRKSYLQLSLDAPSVSSCCWY
ncbi:ras and EF-hand domain-containing protein-like isoform X2 [Denticeps clupeoides]|nr:ras and EF-hand domain-containing protein-like isoform X2 [Denticeps clupeoides]